MKIVLSFILAYLIGSLSSATIIARVFYKIDIKEVGSGNAGATNVLRAFGKKAGLAVFVFDCLKGFIAVLLGSFIGGDYGSYAATAGAIIGHTWPIYFNFKGGKGIATAVGVLIYHDLKMILLLIGLFIIIVALTRYVSLGSIITVALAPIYTYIHHYDQDPVYFYTVLVLAGVIIFNHRSNFRRLLNGSENKIGETKK